MQPKRRTTALVLTGAVGLASAAYGLGSQASDGSAAADSANGNERGRGVMLLRHGVPPGFAKLADPLGVKTSELRDALADFHEQEHADRRDEFATALASALDKPVDEVTAALDRFHEKLEQRFEGQREGFEDGDRPGPPPHGVRRIALPLRQLAAELDVSRADLRQALRDLRPDRDRSFQDHFREERQELAKFLADRFDLDVEKVAGALADLPRPTPPPHGGRPGPGGPGAFGPPL